MEPSSGLFWEVGAAEKNPSNCHKYATLKKKKKPSVCTEKLHNIKSKKSIKTFIKKNNEK